MRSYFVIPVGCVLVVLACSDNNSQPAPKPGASAVCPQSPKDAIGKACGPEGYSCAVGYLCPGEVWQQAHCTCTEGKYDCSDATGQKLAAGMEPACNETMPPTEKCQSAPADIQNKQCMTAGYACYYVGVTCPNQNNGKPYTDDCLCAPHGALVDGGPNVLTWHCTINACL